MMKLLPLTIKKIANIALGLCGTCLFSSQILAQSTKEPLNQRIEASSARVAPARAKAKEVQQRYAVEKAQCWLDFSRHESLRNNPTQAAELAYQKADVLLNALDTGVAATAAMLDSSLMSDDKRMRSDLWDQLAAIKSSKQMACAVKEVACGEVMLVQAAQAHARIDWRYAQPYFGMAEDAVRAAKKQAVACQVVP